MAVGLKPMLVALGVLTMGVTALSKGTTEEKMRDMTMYDMMKRAYTSDTDPKWNKMEADKSHFDRKFLEVFPWQRNCYTTAEIPMEPEALGFCHKFTDKACCIPQLDDDNWDFFSKLTNLGISCRIRGDIRGDPIAELYCINCDPEQPRYIRVGMSMQDPNMTCEMLPTELTSNGTGSVSGAFADPSSEMMQTLLVSREWAVRRLGSDPLLSGPDGRFSKCGLLVSVPCRGDDLDDCGNPIALDGRDRFMCGDDLVIPTNIDVYGILQKDDDGFLKVDESIEAFLNYEDLATPLVNEGFTFKLVSNTFCNETAAGLYLNPTCLRTAKQLRETPIAEAQGLTYRDWMCSRTVALTDSETNKSHINYTLPLINCTDAKVLKLPGSKLCPVDEGKTVEETFGENESEFFNKLINDDTVRCCCGVWLDEKAFSFATHLSAHGGASQFLILLSVGLALLLNCGSSF